MATWPRKVFVSEDLDKKISFWDEKHKHHEWINQMKDKLLEDLFSGDKIRKKQIPRYYQQKYDMKNLYRYRLLERYRAVYTIQFIENLGPCPIILVILSHNRYTQVFRYEKSF